MTKANPHLNDADLRALLDGSADEAARLALAEHISICDRCLLRYTQALTDDILLDPPETLKPGILRRLRERAVRLVFNRYAAAAAAVALAMLLWTGGVFANIVPERRSSPQKPGVMEVFSTSVEAFCQRVSRGLSDLSDLHLRFGGNAASHSDKE